MSAPVLVLGAGGQLGRTLMDVMPDAIGLDRKALDITSAGDVAAAFAGHRPAIVVNAAAYNAVDRAESDRDAAYAVNARAPGAIAELCAERGIAFIHVSTDYVFGGVAKAEPFREEDAVAPLSVYGRSKAEGEERVRHALKRHAIIRTAWVVGPYAPGFVGSVVAGLEAGRTLDVVTDQWSSLTATEDLAIAINAMIGGMREGRRIWGTWHFAGRAPASRYEIAQLAAQEWSRRTGRDASLRPTTLAAFPAPAPRPRYSALDSTRFGETFGISGRPWHETVVATVARLVAEKPAPERTGP
jgi:dTDP-4-dehydrorhamnose reductase